MTYQAVWQGHVIAQADSTVMVEGNHYFPADAVRSEFLRDSGTHTVCGWKGVASYYSIEVDGQVNRDAAWYYPEPKFAAEQIRGRVAFWRGVEVRSVEGAETTELIVPDEACEIDDLAAAGAR